MGLAIGQKFTREIERHIEYLEVIEEKADHYVFNYRTAEHEPFKIHSFRKKFIEDYIAEYCKELKEESLQWD